MKSYEEKLQTARYDLNLSKTRLAKILGISPQYYNDLEMGRRTPGPDLAKKIHEKLGVVYHSKFIDSERAAFAAGLRCAPRGHAIGDNVIDFLWQRYLQED